MPTIGRLITILTLANLLLGCTGSNTPDLEPAEISPTPSPNPQYLVYRALIEAQFLSEAGIQRIVIQDHTGVGPTAGGDLEAQAVYIQKSFGQALDPQTLEDFRQANEASQPLADQFGLNVPVILIDQTTQQGLFESDADGWQQFYTDYPGAQGIMTLSGVGFNTAGNQALVYVGNQADFLAGRGSYVLLVKQGDEWVIQDSLTAWIS
jgi:hypothetical protein